MDVRAALQLAALRGDDRRVDGDVDLLECARHDLRAEVALVSVDADAEDVLRVGCVEHAEAALAGDLELDRRALRDLVQRLLLALRLCDEVLGVVVQRLDARIGLLRAELEAGDVAVDRRDLEAADRADRGAALGLDVEARRVADEVAGLLLLEEQALDVLRLVLQAVASTSTIANLLLLYDDRDRVHRIGHQEADADRDPGAGLTHALRFGM